MDYITKHSSNVFRLSAVIYANKNYNISPVTMHREVIEDALFQLDNKDGVTLDYLSNFIEKEYSLVFTEDELKKVLYDDSNKKRFLVKPVKGGENYVMLNSDYRVILESRNTKVLGDYIKEYVQENNLDNSAFEIIYRYLYNIYTNNVDGFNRLLAVKNVKDIASFYAPSESDSRVINGFLDWDNEEKNVSIFNLASYAIEYCLMTSRKGTSLQLDKLQKKVFYLDTNLLYRAIGINGEDRKERTLSFFRKLRDTNSILRLSKVTIEEYNRSIDGHIKKIKRNEAPAVRSKVYTEYVDYNDLWYFYHDWASKNQGLDISVFESTLKSMIMDLKEQFQIEEDTFSPFDAKKCENEVMEMASSIRHYGNNKLFDTALCDAHNIKWVEANRNSGENSIFSAKTFFLSSDWGLYYWDSKKHSLEAPIVLMPSQWLSLLLRYGNRTSDDFKSFVCFLNIQTKGQLLTSEQISVILSGISKMTTNLEQQKHFLETIIEIDFKDGAKNLTNEQLKKIAEAEAERLLQEELDATKEKLNKAEDKLELSDKEMQELQQQKASVVGENTRLTSKVSELEAAKVQLLADKDKFKTDAEASEATLLKVYEQNENNHRTQRELLKKKAVKKPRAWAWFFFSLAILFFIAMIVIGLLYEFSECEFATTVNKIISNKLVYFGLTGFLGVINYFTINHLYQCYYNATTITKTENDAKIPEDLKELTFEQFKQKHK